jgi:hypothetical protein
MFQTKNLKLEQPSVSTAEVLGKLYTLPND